MTKLFYGLIGAVSSLAFFLALYWAFRVRPSKIKCGLTLLSAIGIAGGLAALINPNDNRLNSANIDQTGNPL